MCLAVPGRINAVEGEGAGRIGLVEFGPQIRRVSLAMVPEAGAGDWLIVHAGVAVRRIDSGEAQAIAADLARLAVLDGRDR